MDNTRNRKNKNKTKDDEYTDNHLEKIQNKIEELKKNIEETPVKNESAKCESKLFRINFEIDLLSISLFLCGLITRIYKLEEPKNIV